MSRLLEIGPKNIYEMQTRKKEAVSGWHLSEGLDTKGIEKVYTLASPLILETSIENVKVINLNVFFP